MPDTCADLPVADLLNNGQERTDTAVLALLSGHEDNPDASAQGRQDPSVKDRRAARPDPAVAAVLNDRQARSDVSVGAVLKDRRSFDPADPLTWPPLMRVRLICTGPDHRGPYPGSATKWWSEVALGRIPRPIKFGKRISCWPRDIVAEVVRKGLDA